MQPYVFTPWAWREQSGYGTDANLGDTAPGGAREADAERDADADRHAADDLAGYHVEALDGRIGSIDEASYDVGRSYMVVDTGPGIFGHKGLFPAGTVPCIAPN